MDAQEIGYQDGWDGAANKNPFHSESHNWLEYEKGYNAGREYLTSKRCCGNIKKGLSHRLKLQEFIKKSNTVHKNLYDYSKTVYEKSSKKVIIIYWKSDFLLKMKHSKKKHNQIQDFTTNENTVFNNYNGMNYQDKNNYG